MRSLFSFVVVLTFLSSSVLWASSTLREVVSTGPDELELRFDKEVNLNQIKTEYFRDIVQLSIDQTAIYPAKIFSVKGPNVKKVFAYQYTPELVRCRLTLKDEAGKFKGKVHLQAEGKKLKVKVGNTFAQDNVVMQSAKSVPAVEKQNELLNEVLSGKNPEGDLFSGLKKEPKSKKSVPKMPNPLNAFGWLFGVLFLIFVGFILFKKFRFNGGKNSILAKFKGNKMIEVVSTKYLGPKSSIAVVRVKEKLMVVGITSESISLITRLDEEESGVATPKIQMGDGAEAAGHGIFSEILNDEERKPEIEKPVRPTRVRARIREKVEGLKSL